jgi:molecular chaperone DnaK (HSP70)
MDNNLLCKFELFGIPPVPHDVSQINMCFNIDANSVLNVSVLKVWYDIIGDHRLIAYHRLIGV